MSQAITLSEFRKLSAAAIQALSGTVPIKEGDETIGLLLPVRRRTPEELAAISAELDALEAMRTPEQQAEYDAALARWERERE